MAGEEDSEMLVGAGHGWALVCPSLISLPADPDPDPIQIPPE